MIEVTYLRLDQLLLSFSSFPRALRCPLKIIKFKWAVIEIEDLIYRHPPLMVRKLYFSLAQLFENIRLCADGRG